MSTLKLWEGKFKILFPIFLFLFIPFFGFSQTTEKKILFEGDSTWYAVQNNFLFSSSSKGEKWDTIFGKGNRNERFFLNGVLDTSTNVFISDQKTIFVFGWDGTMLYKTIVFSSTDGGKTWGQSQFEAESGLVGVKYFHKISSTQFFLDRRYGNYSVTTDCGKTWRNESLMTFPVASRDEKFSIDSFGKIQFGYLQNVNSIARSRWVSSDGGLSWSLMQ